MERFDLFAFERLCQLEQPGCVSLFLPTHRNGANTPQDQLRYRNLLRAADSRLAAEGWRAPDIATLLEPGFRLLTDSAFWRQLDRGLAVFLSTSGSFEYRVPLALPERYCVARRFQLKLLLPLLQATPSFYLLTLSQNVVRLYRGTAEGLAEIPAAHLPHSLAETLAGRAFEKELRVRTGAPVGAGRSATASIFYSSSGENEKYKDELERFCHQVARGVQEWLAGDTTPLVLAGVAYEVALFREHNSYPHVAEAAIFGNPDRLPPEALHQQAWEIVAPQSEAQRAAAEAQYRQLAGTRRATHDLRSIVRAAWHGRVQTLFAAEDGEAWGRFDPSNDAIHPLAGPVATADDLVNFAAVEVQRHGGSVFVMPQTELPANKPLAAILRY